MKKIAAASALIAAIAFVVGGYDVTVAKGVTPFAKNAFFTFVGFGIVSTITAVLARR